MTLISEKQILKVDISDMIQSNINREASMAEEVGVSLVQSLAVAL